MDAFGDFWTYVTTSDSWWGPNGIANLTWAHVRLAFWSTFAAAVLALPPAIVLGHLHRGGLVAVSLVNLGRAIPSFGVIALVLPFSIEWGFGLGYWPTFVALVLLGVPPIFTNTYTGVRGVDPGIVESARGMGMTSREVVLGVEVPSAMPLIITGVRISAVQIVATATLGALVGFQCLGTLVVQGIAQFDDGKLVTGAVLVALLAILVEVALGLVQRRVTPWASRASGARRSARVGVADAGV
ncbi:MAG TPA: ABC transporter permease [Acidimicrobiia bacterium]|nr:ABC transporter permease [Acidimicrobiia bacterium]